MGQSERALRTHLDFLYSPDVADATWNRLAARLERFEARHPERSSSAPPPLDQRDAILITYGDQIREPGRSPLQSLHEFLAARTGDFLTGVHILPFFPYTSDDGFSVVDYLQVDPALGSWEDVERIADDFRLMADAVINHISASSEWFERFRAGEAPYRDFFITVPPETDLSMVVRPRALPLLTAVESAQGLVHVWTTFSEDQIDLNFANPEVLLAVTDVLLRYVAHGSQLIRLDAIAYLWKEPGTPCIHLPQTHRVVQFWRAALDRAAPGTLLITETNVPHEENISYFGDGTNEAQMVYQFPLPPLTLHAFHRGDASTLQRWAAGLATPSDETTFFNFLASHDGIGVRPLEGIVPREEILELGRLVEAHGGFVSYRNNPDGSRSPYELNINYFDALNDPQAEEPAGRQVDRFMAAQAILLAMRGVPGIYIHSLLGSRGWAAGVVESGRARTINREKFERATLERELDEPGSRRQRVLARFAELLRARASAPAFHPQAGQEVVPSQPELFCLLRQGHEGSAPVLCLHEVSGSPQTFEGRVGPFERATDLLDGTSFSLSNDGTLRVPLSSYAVRWLRLDGARS